MPQSGWCASGRRERVRTIAAPLCHTSLDARPRGVPPSPSYAETGRREGWSLAHVDADAGATTPSACLQHPLTPAPFRDTRRRRASKMRMRCARRVCSVVVLASRPRAASNGPSQRRLSDVSAPDAAEYARANEVLCGALWPQPAAQQALQRVSVSLLHMLAADLGSLWRGSVRAARRWRMDHCIVGSWAPRRGRRRPILIQTAPLTSTRPSNGREPGAVTGPRVCAPAARHECSQRSEKPEAF